MKTHAYPALRNRTGANMPTILRVHRRCGDGHAALIGDVLLDESDGRWLTLEIETRICPSCGEEFIAGDRQLYCREKCRFDFNNPAKKLRAT